MNMAHNVRCVFACSNISQHTCDLAILIHEHELDQLTSQQQIDAQNANAKSFDEVKCGIELSLQRFDFMGTSTVRNSATDDRARCSWMLLAYLDEDPAGFASITRIPKADTRCGFAFIDELFVSKRFRRLGVASALLERVKQFATEDLGLAGVRLLCRVDNMGAQALYSSQGFAGNETLFLQWCCQESSSHL